MATLFFQKVSYKLSLSSSFRTYEIKQPLEELLENKFLSIKKIYVESERYLSMRAKTESMESNSQKKMINCTVMVSFEFKEYL